MRIGVFSFILEGMRIAYFLAVFLLLVAGGFLFAYSGSWEEKDPSSFLKASLVNEGDNLLLTNQPQESLSQDLTSSEGFSQNLASEKSFSGQVNYYCSSDASFFEETDKKFCFYPPKLNRWRLFEINLSDNRILFYENGLLKKTFPVAYQAPYGKWFQTPTGFFEIGVKKKKFLSSIVPVFMENAVQLYEDFFIHSIPYYQDGTKVSSQFSGGCLRLEDKVAEDFFQTAQTGDVVVSYLTFEGATLKEGFFAPVDVSSFWIRQRFNSPLKNNWNYFQDKRENYIQHSGLDLAPLPDALNLNVFSIYPGVVEKIILNGKEDGGLGNTIILKHQKDGETFYSLYGHLESLNPEIKEGDYLKGGSLLGKVGNTGFGCRFWKVGEDGCQKQGEDDLHLHLEIKTAPVLGAPLKDECLSPKGTTCVGYTSSNPQDFGYFDPLVFIFNLPSLRGLEN